VEKAWSEPRARSTTSEAPSGGRDERARAVWNRPRRRWTWTEPGSARRARIRRGRDRGRDGESGVRLPGRQLRGSGRAASPPPGRRTVSRRWRPDSSRSPSSSRKEKPVWLEEIGRGYEARSRTSRTAPASAILLASALRLSSAGIRAARRRSRASWTLNGSLVTRPELIYNSITIAHGRNGEPAFSGRSVDTDAGSRRTVRAPMRARPRRSVHRGA